MKDLLTLLCDCLEKGRPMVLASVLVHQGSTPRGAGSRLLADQDGLVAGTVGGGLLEGQTLEACRTSLREGKARILDFMLGGEFFVKGDMICGGELRVLIEPLLPPAEHLPFFLAVRDALHAGGAILLTDITDASRPLRMACIGGARIGAPLPQEALDQLLAAVSPMQETSVLTHADRSYFLERCLPPQRMIIVGGGHVSLATAQVAALAGFEVTVLDDRAEFSRPERFPWAAHTATVPDYLNCFADCAPDPRSCIVIVTRGHLYDAAVLSQALATQAGYIGMIGSTRKRDEVYAALCAQGADEKVLAKVHCPVGLTIGAETPEEIAVSIVAECIAHRRKACPPDTMPR
jgi:xanthine dehydrogenase accessory factor